MANKEAVIAINGMVVDTAETVKIYHWKTEQWHKAVVVNGKTYVSQENPIAQMGWGYEYLGTIQGFTHKRKCSLQEWNELTFAPNPYDH